MSHSTMYVSGGPDKTFNHFQKDYGNGWGYGPMVWEALLNKYECWRTPEATLMELKPTMPGMMMWPKVWDYEAANGLLRQWEYNVLIATYDNVVVQSKDFVKLADSMVMFEQAHATPNRVCHLAAMAEDLYQLNKHIQAATGLLVGESVPGQYAAWNGTSVNEFWGDVAMHKARQAEPDYDPDVDYAHDPYSVKNGKAAWLGKMLTPDMEPFKVWERTAWKEDINTEHLR